MGSGTPLLNHYKQQFFWKRFAQTVLGGVRLRLGFRAPAYVYLSQLIVFLLPLLIGGVFTALAKTAGLENVVVSCGAGSVMVVVVLVIQITARVTNRKTSSSVSPTPHFTAKNILSEEDEVDFDSCCSSETIAFIIPPKKYIVNLIFHAVLSGPLVGMATLYLLPSTLETMFGNVGVTVVLFALGWFTVCVAQYSLSVAPPTETAVYRATDSYELNSLTRPFYVLVCLTIHILDITYLLGLQQADEVLHIVFVLLPVLWMVGILPPIDALFLWGLEQTYIFLLGGSPMASDLRLFLMSLLSGLLCLVVMVIPTGNHYITLAATAGLGYILSSDLGALGTKILHRCRRETRNIPRRIEHMNTGFLWQWTGREAAFHICMTVIVGGVAAGVSYLYKTYSSATLNLTSYISYAIAGVLVLTYILGQVQSVYLFLGIIRNCVFPASVDRSSVFKPGKKRLVAVGHFRRVLANFIGPCLMLVYLALSFDFDVTSAATVPELNKLGAVRAFRWIWQSSVCSTFEMSVVLVVDLSTSSSTWSSLGLGVQLMIISITRDRLSLIINKLYFWFTLTVKSWSDPKQRRRSTAGVIACNFLLFPLVLAVICLSAVLAAPLFPLFTLPLFFIAFPRPTRFWPGTPGRSQSTCGDTVYYEQAAPQVARAFCAAFTSGSIGDARPGRHYLVRFQDRLVWVQVLERGYTYCTLSIKGMELQETSCHAVEATRVDDILQETFENARGVCCKRNNYLLNTVRPYDVRHITAYSDAKNQLTGVIDSPDTLKAVKSCFVKTLIWVFLHHIKQCNQSSAGSDEKKGVMGRTKTEMGSHSNIVKPVPVISTVSLGTAEELSPRKPTQRPQSSGGHSVNSFVNSLWSDDEDSLLGGGSNHGNEMNLLHAMNHQSHLGTGMGSLPPVEKKSMASPAKSLGKQEDIDHLFEELEFGLPATDVNHSKDTRPILGNFNASTDVPSYNFTSSHSHKLSFPVKWTQLPLDEGKVRLHSSQFDHDWFRHVVLLIESQSAIESQSVAKEMSEDKQLVDMYSRVIATCHAIVYDLGLSGNDAVSAGPAHVYKIYKGEIPWSIASDWLTDDNDLLALVLKAFRYSVKLAIDQALLGEATSPEEFDEYLEEYDAQWYLGTETDPQWNTSIAKAKPNLFSLAYDTKQATYTSRVLTAQETPVYISSLNPEAVHAQWANLNMEMLYMTNDDEERYSIQAHASLLRNLNVQAADPPLGYPIYASEPVSVPIL